MDINEILIPSAPIQTEETSKIKYTAPPLPIIDDYTRITFDSSGNIKKDKMIRDKKTAMILAFGLGCIGAHDIYLGRYGFAILKWLFVSSGISFVWAFIDGCLIWKNKMKTKKGALIV